MKKILALLIAAVLVISLAACTGNNTGETVTADDTDNKDVAIVGGFTKVDSPEVTDELKALLEKATAELDGADYVPVAYIATQVVAGTNHLILCKTAPVVPDAKYTYALVTVYEDLEGNAEMIEIKNSEVEAPSPDTLVGGWSEPESPALTDEAKAALDKASETLTGAEFDPIALVGTQVVAGTNYRLLCKETATVPDAESFYTIIDIYADLNGNAELTETYDFV